ncbi:actin maturation protease [Latimeria chalumnae]|uniref:Actin maturation protease n=1 Tax=Latimeria chalumnae TaxID=7897 RepID=H3BE36_LATCH
MSQEALGNSLQDSSVVSPPIPPPPPLPLMAHVRPQKKKLYQTISESRSPVIGDVEEAKMLLKSRESSFSKELRWLLFNKYVPSLIQDGPQCGLVALWMAGPLLLPGGPVPMEKIVNIALKRGYTAQGEMFSAADMLKLAQEVFHCEAELVSGGMMGNNQRKILRHLVSGCPLLLPYDEDFNHEPCAKKGHKAHWAVVSGVLLGLKCGSLAGLYQEDPELSGLFYPPREAHWHCPPEDGVVEIYLLAKQGKSLKYQLWEYQRVHESNMQLTDLDPSRAADGTVYVLPQGGVKSGLCGHTVLLKPGTELTEKA